MTIASSLSAYTQAHASWLAVDAGDCEGPEWETFAEAEATFFQSPCQTLNDVRAKAEAILANPELFDALVNDWTGPEHRAKQFLRSLLGGGAA